MLPLLLPIGITGLAGVSYLLSRRRKKIAGMTAKRQIIYDHAIRRIKDPEKLRALAAAFQDAGLTAQADLLNKRATLRELPEELKVARREAYRKGMTLTDPAKILKLADAFAAEGCTGAAASLKDYAAGLGPNAKITTEDAIEDDDIFAPEPTEQSIKAAAPAESNASISPDVVVPPEGVTSVESEQLTLPDTDVTPPPTIEAEGIPT